jgi:mannose-6-phosphate isomerase-like protein (cupin superfamily)
VIAFEREVVVRAGQIADVDVVLNAAPVREPPVVAAAATPAPEPPPPAVGPVGQPQVVSIVDLVERELISGNAPRKDTLVSCSGNTRTMLIQLNQPQASRVYESAESLYYVVAGEGTISIGEREVPVAAGGYAAVPRGTAHALARRGRRPLILLAVLNGEACEEAR